MNAQFVDDFDSYGTGVNVDGMNGWQGWDGVAAASASTSADQALSAPNSIAITDTTDLINELGKSDYEWEMVDDRRSVHLGSNHNGTSYFIMQNTYNDGGPYNWSIELAFFGDGAGTLSVLFDDFQFVPDPKDPTMGEFLWTRRYC